MAGKRSSPSHPSGVALLGDIGGTHARFALLAQGRISEVTTLDVADYSGPYPAMQAFLGRQAPGAQIDRACLAIAGWIEEGRATLTNGNWTLDEAEMCQSFKLK